MPALGALPRMSKSGACPVPGLHVSVQGVLVCVQAFTSLPQSRPHRRSSSCSTWCTSGSMKYLRLQGCDPVMQLLHSSRPPLLSKLDSGLMWRLFVALSISAFICLSSSPPTNLLLR